MDQIHFSGKYSITNSIRTIPDCLNECFLFPVTVSVTLPPASYDVLDSIVFPNFWCNRIESPVLLSFINEKKHTVWHCYCLSSR